MDFAALQHSLFLHALGSAILNSLWQCFMLWLVYETISVSYKSASARFKNNFSTLLLFLSFAWFLSTLIYKILNQPNTAALAVLSNDFSSEPQTGIHAASNFSTFLSYAAASLPYLSIAYIFLLIFLISRLFAAYRYVYFISNKRLMHPTKELQAFAATVASKIGIAKKISVWISHHIDVPATIGFLKPVILIPLASINNLSSSQLEAIILHELGHIKRNDYITNLIISVIETVLFFNPFVVLLSGIIKRERENCCDDFVLQYQYDPHSYASALLRLEQSRMSKLRLAIGAVSGKKQLLSRIKRITNSPATSKQFNYGQKVIALLLVTAAIWSVAWLTPEEKKALPAKALAKKLTPPDPVIKLKSTTKPVQPVDVLVSDKPVNVVPGIALKEPSQKNEQVATDEADMQNDEADNVNNSPTGPAVETGETDGNTDQQDLKAEKFLTYEAMPDLSKARVFFDQKALKLPPFISIENFPFKNMNLKFDAGKMNFDKLNQNLKLARKKINTYTWNKIQNEIQKSFAKMKMSSLSQKEQDALLKTEKAKALSQLKLVRVQQQFNPTAILEQLEKAVLIDSLHNAEAALAYADPENNNKGRQTYKIMQRQYERRNEPEQFYYNYSNTTPPTAIADNDEDEVGGRLKRSATASAPKKTIKISIRRASNQTGVLSEKLPFQFSLSSDNTSEKPSQENVISVEITDTP